MGEFKAPPKKSGGRPVVKAPLAPPVARVPVAGPGSTDLASSATSAASAAIIAATDGLPVAPLVVEQNGPPAVVELAEVSAATVEAPEPVDGTIDQDAAIAAPAEPVSAFFNRSFSRKGFFDMATAFDTPAVDPAAATQKVQALFGGLNDQAKSAVEKGTKFGEELSEVTKGNVEALVASGKVIAKGTETLTQEATEFGKKSFESATAHFKTLATVKSPTELFQLQSEFAKSSFENLIAEASRFSEAWLKLAGEVTQPLSNRYAVAADKLKGASAL